VWAFVENSQKNSERWATAPSQGGFPSQGGGGLGCLAGTYEHVLPTWVTVGAVMPRHGDWQLEAAGIGGVWGRGGRVHGCGA